jgi:hypothetical protein
MHRGARFFRWVIPVLLAGFLLAGPQFSANAQKQTESAAPKKSEAAPSITITGCMHKGGGGHFTVGAEGKKWEVSSKTVKLEDHVEQTVELTGYEIHPAATAEAKTANSGREKAPGAYLLVSKLRVVMSPCGQ